MIEFLFVLIWLTRDILSLDDKILFDIRSNIFS